VSADDERLFVAWFQDSVRRGEPWGFDRDTRHVTPTQRARHVAQLEVLSFACLQPSDPQRIARAPKPELTVLAQPYPPGLSAVYRAAWKVDRAALHRAATVPQLAVCDEDSE
jgi:hypothetical protein